MIQAFFYTSERKKSMEKTGKFRKREKPFTQVSNTLLRDQNISLKAKGLYCLISSYLNMINFTLYKGTLKKSCQEGRDSFDKAWNELKEAGYLIQHKTKANNGRFIYEYELLDEPAVDNYSEEDNFDVCENNLSFSQSTNNSTNGNPVSGKPVHENSVSLQNTSPENMLTKNSLLNTNNSVNIEVSKQVVANKNIAQTDIDAFFEKSKDLIIAYFSVDDVKNEVSDTCFKLSNLLKTLPSNLAEHFRSLSKEQACSLIQFAWKTYYPDSGNPHKEYIFNPDGYIIGYMKNQLLLS